MNGYDLFASLFASFVSLGWPAAVFGGFWLFRSELRALLPKLTAKWGDMSITFAQGFETGQASTVQEIRAAKQADEPKGITREISTFEDLPKLSNSELKAFTQQWADRMRDMDYRHRQQRDEAMHMPRDVDPQANWDLFTKRFAQQSTDQAHEWRSTLHPTAIALRDELMKRGAQEPQSSFGPPVALDPGLLAGANPLHEAALWLERLARSLPGNDPNPSTSSVHQ